MKMLELGAEFTNMDFNIEVSIAPSSQERAAILQDLLALKQQGEASQGAAGITPAQYMYLYDKVMAGQIKSAYFTLAKMEARRRAEAQAQKDRDIQANGEVQQQSLMAKGQIDGQLLERKGQQEMENTLVKELLASNREVLNELIKSRKPDDIPPNAALGQMIITQNTEDVGEILMGEDEQQEVPQEEMAPVQ